MNTRKLHWAALGKEERMGGRDGKGKDVGKTHHKEWGGRAMFSAHSIAFLESI